jgi:Protein of unknown function (DUF2752)
MSVIAPLKPMSWLAPVATAAAGVGALVYVRGIGASGSSIIPACSFHALTGWWCPGCGLTRGTRALLHGDVIQALGYNLLTPFVLGMLIYTWASWALPRLGGPTLPSLRRVPATTWKVIGAIALIFAMVRNLPIQPLAALAP